MRKTLNKSVILLILISLLLAFNLSAAKKGKAKKGEKNVVKKELPAQSGIGTVDRYMAHGKEVYRFVPVDKELRMVKFVPGQLGYKKNKLPEEYETILAKALAEKTQIYFECKYFDHGAGKTAIGKKIIVLKFAEENTSTDF